MRMFKAEGKTGRKYYVFSRKKKPELAIKEASRAAHYHPDDMTIISAWVKGEDLYLEPVTGAEKMQAVIRRSWNG